MFKKITIFLLILFFFLSQFGLAQELDGDQVLEKVEASRQANSHQMKMEMELYSSSGDMRSRELNNYRLGRYVSLFTSTGFGQENIRESEKW
jgi:hypothetical protein